MYYVYIYFDPRENYSLKYNDFEFNFKPFYVGKGKNARLHEHLKDAKKQINTLGKKSHKINTIISLLNSGCEPIIEIIFESENEVDCLLKEQELIKLIGRRNLFQGPLTNLTDGGEGTSNIIKSEETILKASNSKLGNKNPMFGKKHTDSTKNKMSQKAIGKTKQESTKNKISDTVVELWKQGVYDNKKQPPPVTAETKKRISKSLKEKNIKHTDEYKQNMSEIKKACMTDEIRKKMSDAKKEYWKKRKLENHANAK